MEGTAKTATLDPNLLRHMHRALTAGKEELFLVLEETSQEVLRAALKNPALDENHLLVLLKRRDLSEDILRALYTLNLVEQSHQLKVALVRNPNTPGPVVLTLLPHLHLFELVTICRLPGATPDQKLAAERAIIQRLPATPLGNKLTLARNGTPTVVAELLKEGDTRVVEVCLSSPALKEGALFQFLNGPTATAETISSVARHPRWSSRPNLLMAILKNYRTPTVWFTVLLPRFRTPEIRALLSSRSLNPVQRKAVEDELKRRGHT